MSKTDKKTFFAYYGWTIPVSLTVFWVIFYAVLNGIYAPKAYEQLSFFYAAYGLKDESIHYSMQRELESKGCYEVNYYDYSLNDRNLYEKYEALKDSDYFVFSEHDLTEMGEVVKDLFMVIDFTFLNQIHLPAKYYNFYEFEGVRYGIKLFDKDDDAFNEQSGFDEIINFTYENKVDSFYLVANAHSINFNFYEGYELGFLGLEYLFKNV